jgi:hypothetical protein
LPGNAVVERVHRMEFSVSRESGQNCEGAESRKIAGR